MLRAGWQGQCWSCLGEREWNLKGLSECCYEGMNWHDNWAKGLGEEADVKILKRLELKNA